MGVDRWVRLASLSAALLASAVLIAPEAAASGLDSRSGDGQLSERSHRVELTFDRGYASLRGQWTVENEGSRPDDASLWIGTTAPMVATGIRLLDERGRWHTAKLLPADAAERRFLDEHDQPGSSQAGVGALLGWDQYDEDLQLHVGPIAPGAAQTVEYTMTVPARWEQGRWVLELHELGTEELPAPVILTPAHRSDRLHVEGQVVASGHVTTDGSATVSLEPANPKPVELALASVPTGKDRSLVHWRVSVAQLSELPKDARVVVALDLSRSREPEQIEAQRAAAIAYLENLREPALGAKVALLGFDRAVHPLSPGFVAASTAIEVLTHAELRRRNGSEVGLALAEADALLSATNPRHPRRIVLLSDFATASRVTPELLEDTVGHSRAVVHFADVDLDTEPSLERDDDMSWAPLAASTGGVSWYASLDDSDPLAARAVLEEWARPLRLDHVRVSLDGVDVSEIDDIELDDFDGTLDEGQGLEALLLAPDGHATLTLDGLRWGEPVHHDARPSASEGRRWAALVFGTELQHQLDSDECLQLATHGGAVSDETSYLAETAGDRPAREWNYGDGTTCMCDDPGLSLRGHGSGYGRTIHVDPFDPQAWLALNLPPSWRACGGHESARVTIETTWDEVVDVEVNSSADAAVRACMVEMLWALEPPDAFRRRDLGRYTVELAGR